MTTAERRTEAKVITLPVFLLFQQETDGGTLSTKSPEGEKIVVVNGGEVILERDVYPFFVGLRRVFGVTVPRPRYAQRVTSVEERANQIAMARNFINAPVE